MIEVERMFDEIKFVLFIVLQAKEKFTKRNLKPVRKENVSKNKKINKKKKTKTSMK